MENSEENYHAGGDWLKGLLGICKTRKPVIISYLLNALALNLYEYTENITNKLCLNKLIIKESNNKELIMVHARTQFHYKVIIPEMIPATEKKNFDTKKLSFSINFLKLNKRIV